MNPLLIDLYELTMAASYLKYKKDAFATFDLFIRQLPPERRYFVFAGLQDALRYLAEISFSLEDIRYLRGLRQFSDEFLDYLLRFRFTGDVLAMPEGAVFFPEEPVIRVTAPLIEAQIVESSLLNIVNLQTTMATKAARVVQSAKGRPVYDFGLRRTQGTEAALQAARCGYIAGCKGTSNVLAGKLYGIPVVGTMAHSFVMSFQGELESFSAFADTFPKNTILLIDTYDEMKGLENAIKVAKKTQKRGNRLIGIRLDSGNLVEGSKRMRRILDRHGLGYVKILASGNLDEYKIKGLLDKGARIDSFGVGTHMGTSSDMPYSDVIYKIAAVTDSKGRFLPTMKLSKGKRTFPGLKQVFRREFWQDIISLEGEKVKGARPLLIKVMEKGRIIYNTPSLKAVQAYCLDNIRWLPHKYKSIDGAGKYPVLISPGLKLLTAKIENRLRRKIPSFIFMDIDTQYDFINRNGRLSVPGAEKIVPNLKKLTGFAKRKNIFVLASMDTHSMNDPEFKKFPPHCIKGTKGQKKVPETRLKEAVILEKNKLSVFTNPKTKILLSGVEHVYIYGVTTEYCVREAALGLRKMGIGVTVVKDAVRAVDSRAGKRSLIELKKKGVAFVKTADLIRCVL